MVATTILTGLAAGLAATGVMSMTEYPAWRRWGLPSTLEWHENQTIAGQMLRRRPEDAVAPGLVLHFIHGGLAGVVFILALALLALPYPPVLLGFPFGFLLWLITLVIHRPITGVRPWRHPRGRAPALASLGGHLAYGVVLGLLVGFL